MTVKTLVAIALAVSLACSVSFAAQISRGFDTTYHKSDTQRVEVISPLNVSVKPYYDGPKENRETKRYKSDSEQTERLLTATENTAHWTLLAAIFAAIAVFVSLCVWVGSTRASIGITDHHWIAQNITGFWIHIGLKNNGHSDARKMRFTYNFRKVWRNGFKEVCKEQLFEDYLPECAPGETVMLKAGVIMTDSDIESKRDGSDLRDVVFWGVVYYYDIFKRRHQKPFRFYVSWPDVKDSVLTLNRWHTDYENEKDSPFFRGLD